MESYQNSLIKIPALLGVIFILNFVVGCGDEIVVTPKFTPTPGTYTSEQSIRISCATPGAEIYYTTDKSTPNAKKTKYTMTIKVAQSMTIKAIAIKSGMTNSTIASGTYIINIPVPVATIVPPVEPPLIVELGGDVTIEMIRIPAGTFKMGSTSGKEDESPVHMVTISNDYYIGKYEVTIGQWEKVMGSTPSNFKNGDDYPADKVTWNMCQDFISKLHNKHSSYGKFRLPTEAEWEYACRAGTSTSFYWGNSDVYMNRYAWYSGVSGLTSKHTDVVGQRMPNAFGLYDMPGNVWEWCNDWYGGYLPDEITDPTGPPKQVNYNRVIRGGSWNNHGEFCRSAARYNQHPDYGSNTGMRLALSPKQ